MHELSFLYQYGVGGTFFLVCTFLAVRSGAVDLTTRAGKRHLALLLGGLVYFAALHAFSVFILPEV